MGVGEWRGNLSRCSETPSPCLPGIGSGACCCEAGAPGCGFDCDIGTSEGCGDVGGDYQGDLTTCDPNPCLATGACCDADVCTEDVDETICTDGGGTYRGDDSMCLPTSCLGACDRDLIQPIRLLRAVKFNLNLDLQMAWTSDANANAYNVWFVNLKTTSRWPAAACLFSTVTRPWRPLVITPTPCSEGPQRSTTTTCWARCCDGPMCAEADN